MYKSFYSFKERPFSTLPDPDYIYMSKKHEMALAYLEYGLSTQASFMVLTGVIGSGKTTLINYLINKIDDALTKIALILNTHINTSDFLKVLLKEWDIDCDGMGKNELNNLLNDFLISQHSTKTRVVLIIDEAQNLSFELLEEIRMISNLNDEKAPLLHIILLGQPNFINRLNHPELEQLRQRVSVHYHLDPLDRDDTFQYIKHRLKRAGAKDLDIFTPEALYSIHTHSAGIPRIINLICDMALVHGYAEQKKSVDNHVIELVVEDRKKMGLDFQNNSAVTKSGSAFPANNNHKNKIESLEKKQSKLNQNVFKLALAVKKMLQSNKFGD